MPVDVELQFFEGWENGNTLGWTTTLCNAGDVMQADNSTPYQGVFSLKAQKVLNSACESTITHPVNNPIPNQWAVEEYFYNHLASLTNYGLFGITDTLGNRLWFDQNETAFQAGLWYNGAHLIVTPLVTQNVWHKCRIEYDTATQAAEIFYDNVSYGAINQPFGQLDSIIIAMIAGVFAANSEYYHDNEAFYADAPILWHRRRKKGWLKWL
jgi:hypothetical protein